MAHRLNCGEVQPYSSLWAPTDKGEMEQSLEVEPVHVYQRTWEETVNQAEAQAVSVKYMFVAMTQQEYNAQSIDDGTLPAVQHTHHNTGFTSWPCSFHDAVAYMLWCIATAVAAYTPVFYMVMFVPNVRKVLTYLTMVGAKLSTDAFSA